MEKYILFAGDPDQSILYAGQILIESAAEAGWHAACISSGRQGEVSHCMVLISKEPIQRRPLASPDMGVLVSLPAADAFERAIRPGGLLVLNATAMRRPVLRRDVDVIMTPVAETAADPALASLTLLGALVALAGWMSVDEVMAVVRKSCVGNAACAAFRQGATFVDEMLLNASAQAA